MTDNTDKKEKSIGRFLALILRHKPEIVGIALDKNGWSNVGELIEGIGKTVPDFDIQKLEQIVADDSKQRYSFNADKTKIRANQGHSINVDVELLEMRPPETLYHGSAEKFKDLILKDGIEAKSRLYVHLSKDAETAVKVGSRHGKPVVFIVDSGKMYKEGYKFFISENRVYLTKYIPAEYITIAGE